MKKKQNWLILTLLLISISLLIFWFLTKRRESFENLDNNFDMYVITLKQKKRMENISKQEQKIDHKITIFDAVKGDSLDIDKLIKDGLVSEKSFKDGVNYRKREIGCYMSHLNIYNLIKDSNNSGYTLILEDDFNLKTDNFLRDIDTLVSTLKNNNINFDMLFLGNHMNNHGEKIIGDVYKINKNEMLLGTHCYLVDNKHIDKIINATKYIDCPIDIKLDTLCKSNKLDIYVVYPVLADQGGSDYSSIRDMSIETFVNSK
jgi:GR25 family glycosyltransferase involved in LPS biosynthesis